MTAPEPKNGRQTAPQGPYSLREVGIGLLVLLVGLLITYAIPMLAS